MKRKKVLGVYISYFKLILDILILAAIAFLNSQKGRFEKKKFVNSDVDRKILLNKLKCYGII